MLIGAGSDQVILEEPKAESGLKQEKTEDHEKLNNH